jgi:hypothetical protein
VFVVLAVLWIAPADPVAAWLLAIIAVSGAPATVMAVISELQARSRACDTLLGSSALDSIITVVLYAVAAPFLMWSLSIHRTLGAALAHTAQQVLGALVNAGELRPQCPSQPIRHRVERARPGKPARQELRPQGRVSIGQRHYAPQLGTPSTGIWPGSETMSATGEFKT